MNRPDLSSQLIHLTKGDTVTAVASFRGIVRERALLGGTGYVRGGYRVVCMSEAPLGAIAPLLLQQRPEFRYRPFGVLVSKEWFYERGGRTVIYQEEARFELLAESERFRHVRHELPGIDFTHEREWRLRTDRLDLDPHRCTLVVPTSAWAARLRKEHDDECAYEQQYSELLGLPYYPRLFAWPSILVLESLGLDMTEYQGTENL